MIKDISVFLNSILARLSRSSKHDSSASINDKLMPCRYTTFYKKTLENAALGLIIHKIVLVPVESGRRTRGGSSGLLSVIDLYLARPTNTPIWLELEITIFSRV